MPKKKFNKKEYLKHGGVECPYCGTSNIIEDFSLEGEAGYRERGVRCLECDREWVDVYKLVGAFPVSK